MNPLLSLSCLFLAGCAISAPPQASNGDDHPRLLVLDPTFSTDDQEAMIAGAAQWTQAKGIAFNLTYASPGQCPTGNYTICVVPSSGETNAAGGGIELGLTGYDGSTRSATVTMDIAGIMASVNLPYTRAQLVQFVMAHELGHAMGMGHVCTVAQEANAILSPGCQMVDVGAHLMSPYANTASLTITADDESEWQAVNF